MIAHECALIILYTVTAVYFVLYDTLCCIFTLLLKLQFCELLIGMSFFPFCPKNKKFEL